MRHFRGYEVYGDGAIYGARGRLRAKPDADGYMRVRLTVDGKRTPYFVHRVVLLAFIGDPPTPRHQARHLNGDRTDNHLANLAWGTPRENSADRARHGTTARGERNGYAKLTDDNVAAARVLRAAGWSQQRIANLLGVTQSAISRIEHGQTWRHVPEVAA